MSFANRRRDALLKAVNAVHRSVVRVSGGRLGGTAANLPIIKLTTIGRRSGKHRTVMLALPIEDDDRVIVVASKGGDDRHPAWYLNLVANPEVTVEPVGGDGPIAMVARTATPEEKAELWPRIAPTDDGYDAYQQRTSRDIPVVICEPQP